MNPAASEEHYESLLAQVVQHGEELEDGLDRA
jgi:hypothetical protein